VLTDIAIEKPDKVLPGLMESLDGKEQLAVINTLKVLRMMKVQAAPAILKISALYDKSDAQVRMEILNCLASIDAEGDQSLPILIKALKAPEPTVRKEALIEINRYRSKADMFLDPLIESLNEGDLENRVMAISTLRSLGQNGRKAIPTLEKLTQDPEVRVRTVAVNALANFRPPPDDVLETLSRTLKDSNLDVKLATVGALRQLGYAYPDKVTGLLQSALQEEKNEQARRAMAATLAGISKVKPAASAAGSEQGEKMRPKYR
jgi:HEAT repeat protein